MEERTCLGYQAAQSGCRPGQPYSQISIGQEEKEATENGRLDDITDSRDTSLSKF